MLNCGYSGSPSFWLFFSELIDYSRGVSRLDMCISLVLFFAEFAYLNKKKCAFSVTQSLLISLHQRGAYMIESYWYKCHIYKLLPFYLGDWPAQLKFYNNQMFQRRWMWSTFLNWTYRSRICFLLNLLQHLIIYTSVILFLWTQISQLHRVSNSLKENKQLCTWCTPEKAVCCTMQFGTLALT